MYILYEKSDLEPCDVYFNLKSAFYKLMKLNNDHTKPDYYIQPLIIDKQHTLNDSDVEFWQSNNKKSTYSIESYSSEIKLLEEIYFRLKQHNEEEKKKFNPKNGDWIWMKNISQANKIKNIDLKENVYEFYFSCHDPDLIFNKHFNIHNDWRYATEDEIKERLKSEISRII